MDSKRSERFRYYLPGGYFIICIALIFYPKLLTANTSRNFTNIFILGAGAIIGGFLLNKVASNKIFRKLIGLYKEKIPHGKDIVSLIINKVINEEGIEDSATACNVLNKASGIFDNFLNEECDDKVINRFFFLCDLEHTFITLTLCSFSIMLISFPYIYEQLITYGISGFKELCVLVYIGNLSLLAFFKKSSKIMYCESVRYSDILITSQINKLYQFVRTFIVHQYLVDTLNQDERSSSLSWSKYFNNNRTETDKILVELLKK